MEEKISVTFKAGTGFDVPWIVLKATSIEEMATDLAEVSALFADVSFLGKVFMEAFKSAPSTPDALVKQRLGATQISLEPPTNTEPLPTAALPWDEPQAAAKMPWEEDAPAGTAPGNAPPNLPVLIQLPFAKEGDANYERIRSFKNHFYQNRNKLEWNKGRKGFEFSSTPTPELLAVARQGAAALGGKVVE